MRKSEYVVVVADSKDGYRPLSAPIRRINTGLPRWTEPPKVPEKYLIVGWGPTLVGPNAFEMNTDRLFVYKCCRFRILLGN
jgi:hypothetical protein